MDVIKAIESFSYYHEQTGKDKCSLKKWREKAVVDWHLSPEILNTGVAAPKKM